jgi:hypothetical protein
MKPHPTDVMRRLSAADPARGQVLDEAERARVWQLITAMPGGCAGWRWWSPRCSS